MGFLHASQLDAQFNVEGQLDMGDDNISKGMILRFSGFGHYESRYWGAEAGFQLGLIQRQEVIINSWSLGGYGKIPAGDIIINAGAGYMWTAFASDLREADWIILFSTSLDHWQFSLGNNSRIYRPSRNADSHEPGTDPESTIVEGWNMMYSVSYQLKTPENKWNLGLTVTDYDRFLVMQETNPMVNMRFDYRLTETLQLYSELWYKCAGFFNIKVDYFSTTLRIGAIWEL